MHFEHVSLRFIPWIDEHALENQCYIAHQIYRIIVDHDVPRQIERLFRAGFFFNRRCADSGWRRILRKHFDSSDYRAGHFDPKWLHAHEKMLTYGDLSSNL